MKKLFCYVMGAYSCNPEENTKNAIAYCDELVEFGIIPFCPHLTHFWHKQIPHEYEYWMKYDFEILDRCDCGIWNKQKMPGDSAGARREWQRLLDQGKPAFETTEQLLEYQIDLKLKEDARVYWSGNTFGTLWHSRPIITCEDAQKMDCPFVCGADANL